MFRILTSVLLFISIFTTNVLGEIKVGIIFGFSGPIKSLTPVMAESAEIAFKEASESRSLLDGETIKVVRADSTCKDTSAANDAAKEIISQGVKAIIGGVCSEVTEIILSEFAVPNEIVMISPAATSASLTSLDDKGFFFRTTPSEARGGQILADITKDRRIKKVAITYTNNDYGKDLAKAYKAAVESHGLEVTIMASHNDNKEDYSSEVATLASAGGEAVVIIGYSDNGGRGIIQASIDSGAFDKFILSDRMINQSLLDEFGNQLKKSFGYVSGSSGKRAGFFDRVAREGGIDVSYPYTGESYDAAALIVLAIQAGGSADSISISKNIMDVANEPGTKIYAGEIKKGLDLLSKGKKINYEGATGVSFNKLGEAKGSYLEQEVKNRKFRAKKQR
ncbi:ABC transporter substrate-binding protein [Candidatus Pelagibacter sp.]|nr:ABC transporter substrate-binding protein [Candidatus Pelagibacter sp.]